MATFDGGEWIYIRFLPDDASILSYAVDSRGVVWSALGRVVWKKAGSEVLRKHRVRESVDFIHAGANDVIWIAHGNVSTVFVID